MAFESEFRFRRFGFGDIPDEYIYRIKFYRVPSYLLLLYRCIISLYFVGTGLLSIFDMWDTRWLIFLTTWSWLVSTAYYLIITSISGYYWWKLYNRGNIGTCRLFLPSSLRVITWILFDVSLGIALLVTVMFWGFVAMPKNFRSPLVTYITFNEHLLNLLLLLIDFSFQRIPVRVFHAIYPIIFGCIYLVFSAIYYQVANKVIYSILDWRNQADAAILYIIVSMGFLVIGQVMFYIMDRLKVKYCAPRPIEDDEADHGEQV